MAKKASAGRASKKPEKKPAAKKTAAKLEPQKPTTPRTLTKKTTRKTTAAKKAVPKSVGKPITKKVASKASPATLLDLNDFPPESLHKITLGLCLACVLDVFTRHMGLSAERAHSEVRRYSPSLEELLSETPARPYIAWPTEVCPYCGAASKWLAPMSIVSIEGGKTTDAARRTLVKKIGNNPKFSIIEEKSSEREALYSWLTKIGASLDLDSPSWLLQAARHWLGRRLPKVEWADIFKHIRFVRRSRRLTQEDFEVDGVRLFLAPALFDEVLLIQYLLSRSHKAGGQTFEGRMTLLDLFHRLRGGGYLRQMGITTGNPSEALEKLVEMHGGEGQVKFYYIVDRSEFLARLAKLKVARLPRSKR
jgi:hypothetical protein